MLEDIFNLQTQEEKATYTWEFGTLLATRQQGIYVINLYHVDDFFVEIWYYPENKEIYGVKSFSSSHCYEPYIDDIKIAC
jgi:hypothetical protein